MMLGTSLLASALSVLYLRSTGQISKNTVRHDTEQEATEPQREVQPTIIIQQPAPTEAKAEPIHSVSIPQPVPTKRDLEARDTERAERIAQAFETDSKGDSTSQMYENKFRAALTNPKLSGVLLERMECRSRVCRAVLKIDDRKADDQAFLQLMNETAGTGYSIVVPTREEQSDGKTKAIAYLFAPGGMPLDSPDELANATQ
jgi:hypothetical protein